MSPKPHRAIYNLQTLNMTHFMMLHPEQQQIKEQKTATPFETNSWVTRSVYLHLRSVLLAC